MKRNLRRNIDIALTGLGIGLIFSAVILGGSLDIRAQLPLALIGVLIMEAGVWGLSSKLFPSERRYLRLREEGDRMIDLIRELNNAAIAKDTGSEDARRFQETLQKMHDSVVKMSELAAVEDSSKPAAGNSDQSVS
ncbi:MAG: hypothetical protein MRY76_04670 [Pseudomonadales bacterium]|nr:hypothetical protein [Pseudomonadales bacterium]